MQTAKLKVTFVIYLPYCIDTNGKITATSRFSLPLEGICGKQMLMPPADIKYMPPFYVKLQPLQTSFIRKQHFAVDIHYIGF